MPLALLHKHLFALLLDRRQEDEDQHGECDEQQAGATLDIADIRARLKASLADYKIPRHIEIQNELPREDSGKIFKRRLRDPDWERSGRRI